MGSLKNVRNKHSFKYFEKIPGYTGRKLFDKLPEQIKTMHLMMELRLRRI